jgi:hypothetical protein
VLLLISAGISAEQRLVVAGGKPVCAMARGIRNPAPRTEAINRVANHLVEFSFRTFALSSTE